jgi:hypothetical protein
LNAEVGGSMLETERGQQPHAALVPGLDHRTNLVAVTPIPCRVQNASSERVTNPSSQPLRVHPQPRSRIPSISSSPWTRASAPTQKDPINPASDAARTVQRGVDRLGNCWPLTLYTAHSPSYRQSATISGSLVPSDLRRGVAAAASPRRRVSPSVRTQARRLLADAHLSGRPEGPLIRSGRAARKPVGVMVAPAAPPRREAVAGSCSPRHQTDKRIFLCDDGHCD